MNIGLRVISVHYANQWELGPDLVTIQNALLGRTITQAIITERLVVGPWFMARLPVLQITTEDGNSVEIMAHSPFPGRWAIVPNHSEPVRE